MHEFVDRFKTEEVIVVDHAHVLTCFTFYQENREGVISEAEQKAESLDDRCSCKLCINKLFSLCSFATYYVKVMKKMVEKGNDFVNNEIERLGRLLAGDVSAKKNDEFTKRQNILRKFEL